MILLKEFIEDYYTIRKECKRFYDMNSLKMILWSYYKNALKMIFLLKEISHDLLKEYTANYYKWIWGGNAIEIIKKAIIKNQKSR